MKKLSIITNAMDTSFAVIVPTEVAQPTRKILEELKIWDESRRFKKFDTNKIAIPIINRNFDKDILSGLLGGTEAVVVEMILPKSKKAVVKLKTPRNCLLEAVRKFLQENGVLWTKEMEEDVPSNWEKHGNLILLPAASFKLPLWKDFGDIFWRGVAESLGCSRLALKSVVCNNGFRTPQVNLLLGQNGWVDQIDNKLRFTYDVTKCMFSIGNITEKLRVANFNCKGETVVDLYAGIGYFTVPYLVHAKAEYVHACEWNVDAVEALRKNLKLNMVENRCTVYYGDNKKVCPVNIADRVNLGLIPSSEEGWHVACAALKHKTGGILHIHSNVTTGKPKTSLACHDKSPIEGDNLSSFDNEHTEFDSANQSESVVMSCWKSNEEDDMCDNVTNNVLKPSRNYSSWNEWAESVSTHVRQLLNDYHHCDWTTNVIHIEHVKSYAPHVDHLVLDLECRPL